MMRSVLLFVITSALALIGAPDSLARVAAWQEKVDPQLQVLPEGERVEFLVKLLDQADLRGADSMSSKQDKGTYVYQQLVATAERSQGPLLQMLTEIGADYRAFWVANLIWVRGDIEDLKTLAVHKDVAHIYANPKVSLALPRLEPGSLLQQSVNLPEWNISKIHAPEVWAAGYRGQGITIGGQDTGYDWDHPAIKDQYRGWNGTSVDHNYNWHDAIHDSPGNPCGSDSQEPCDDYRLGHGTHTMGTMVGVEPDLSNQVGVAPAAKWIGCRNMDQGTGSPATYIECYQWFLAPTDLDGLNPDPSRAPHVINNSWSCPTSEGCTEPLVLKEVVEAVRAAGILTVHSAGNNGPTCSSINTPSAIYDASFTVGNTDRYDQIAFSSSRGPVTIDGSGRIKPDVSAPGTLIRSSIPGGGYSTLSGTSMAGPHVAGTVALLLSAQPELIGQVAKIEEQIAFTAVPTQLNTDCGEIPGTSYPNNSTGWGRIDALNALWYGRYSLLLPWISRD